MPHAHDFFWSSGSDRSGGLGLVSAWQPSAMVLRGAAELFIAPGSPMVCSLPVGTVAAVSYHGDRETRRAQGSPPPAKVNCFGSCK